MPLLYTLFIPLFFGTFYRVIIRPRVADSSSNRGYSFHYNNKSHPSLSMATCMGDTFHAIAGQHVESKRIGRDGTSLALKTKQNKTKKTNCAALAASVRGVCFLSCGDGGPLSTVSPGRAWHLGFFVPHQSCLCLCCYCSLSRPVYNNKSMRTEYIDPSEHRNDDRKRRR